MFILDPHILIDDYYCIDKSIFFKEALVAASIELCVATNSKEIALIKSKNKGDGFKGPTNQFRMILNAYQKQMIQHFTNFHSFSICKLLAESYCKHLSCVGQQLVKLTAVKIFFLFFKCIKSK